MEKSNLKKILITVILVFAALLSFFPVTKMAASPDNHQQTIASIDEKVETVMKLTATSTLASAGLSAIPGDTTTPIAEKLADFTEYFLLILCVLYGEKYLLTIIGYGAFRFLIPIACALFAVGLYRNPGVMKKLGIKLTILAVALFFTIPASIRVSDLIYATYQDSIDDTIAAAEQLTDDTNAIAEAEGDQGLLNSIMNKIKATGANISDKAAETLSNYIELLAVLIVTSCIIPVLVLVFFVWIVKVLTGVEIPMGMPGRRKHHHDDKPAEEA